MAHLLSPDLGDLPVLTELAVDVAASRGNRKRLGPGQKMKERLFFDRVDVHGAGFSVYERIIDPPAVLPDAAVTSLFVAKLAITGTEKALDFPVGVFFIVPSFNA